MPFPSYRLSNRFEPLALAPWLLGAVGAAAVLTVAWTLCVWAFAFIPPIFFVRTALGLAACFTVGVFFSATVGVCLQEGKLRNPRAVFWLTLGLAAAGLLAHFAAWSRLFPSLPYGPQLIGGLVVVFLTCLYGGWFALREELFCESCRSWGVRHKAFLTVPGDDPARFLDGLAAAPRTTWTAEEKAGAKQLPNTTLDLCACPCGKTCALTATSKGKDNKTEVRLRFVELSAELSASLRGLEASFDEPDEDEPDDDDVADDEPVSLYRESRPVYRSWGVEAALWLAVAMFVGLIAIAVASVAGLLYVLWARTNGLPEVRPLGMGPKDLGFTAVLLGVFGRAGSRKLREGFRATHAELSIELFSDRIDIRMARVGWGTEIDVNEIEDAQLAEYDPRQARRRVGPASMRSNVLATALFLQSAGTTQGVKLKLRAGESVHIGLENPVAFLAALAKARAAAT